MHLEALNELSPHPLCTQTYHIAPRRMKSSLALLLSCLLLQLLLQQVAVQAQVPAALSVTNREILRTR